MVLKPSRKHSWVPLTKSAKKKKREEKAAEEKGDVIEEGDEDEEEDEEDEEDEDMKNKAKSALEGSDDEEEKGNDVEDEHEEEHDEDSTTISLGKFSKMSRFSSEQGEFNRVCLALLTKLAEMHSQQAVHGGLSMRSVLVSKTTSEVTPHTPPLFFHLY